MLTPSIQEMIQQIRKIETLYWYKQAMEENNARAHYKLGKLYETGSMIAVNLELTQECYERAAAQGYQKALKKLEPLKPEESKKQ